MFSKRATSRSERRSSPTWCGVSDVAVAAVDSPAPWPSLCLPSSSLAYVRMHGEQRLYAGSYSRDRLERWAEQLVGWSRAGSDVLAYFNNDADGRAPYDAVALNAALRRAGIASWEGDGDRLDAGGRGARHSARAVMR